MSHVPCRLVMLGTSVCNILALAVMYLRNSGIFPTRGHVTCVPCRGSSYSSSTNVRASRFYSTRHSPRHRARRMSINRAGLHLGVIRAVCTS
ncbi:hypothetical protein DFH07DRAFT_814011 [Mycena maculata]|uniref:Uncharacterized protein n=1 Tax=Mycena maculata TaxID=230809 RepID=A0AAD7JD27_9AGAR|nr:hypothetical protein DFH07DRAFT_814011 [Mycena maculata]